MLITAALGRVKYGLRLVTWGQAQPPGTSALSHVRIGKTVSFPRVRVAPRSCATAADRLAGGAGALHRTNRRGNLPPEVSEKFSLAQRICHDSRQAIWEVLDRVAHTVMEQVRAPGFSFSETAANWTMRRPVVSGLGRLFDDVSPPNSISIWRLCLHGSPSRRPEYFGWVAPAQAWELEQEHGKWKARAAAPAAQRHAFALYENGLGSIVARRIRSLHVR